MSVARHTIYNAVGASVPIVLTLFTVPIYLGLIGLERYGVLSICWLLLGYFNLFDFGLGRAIAQKIASMVSAPASDRSRTFWTGAAISGALAVVATLLIAPAAQQGVALLKDLSTPLEREFDEALPYLVAALPLGILHSLLVGALEGRRQFLWLNLIVSLGTVLATVLPLCAAFFWGPGLPHLMLAALVGRVFSTVLLVLVCVRHVPISRPETPRSEEIRSLLTFGGWTTVSAIIGPLLVFWDRFGIGAVLGSAAVALYVVPFNLVSQIQVLPNSLTTALLPRLAQLSGPDARKLSDEATALVLVVCTPLTLIMVALIAPFLSIWLDPYTAAAGAPVAYVLLFGFWANSLARIPAVELQASGRPRAIAQAHLAELVPYALLLLVMLSTFGLVGAAVAWALRSVVDAAILYWAAGSNRRTLTAILPHALVLVFAITIAYSLPLWSGIKMILLAVSFVLTLLLIYRSLPPRLARAAQQFRGGNWARP